MEGICGMRPDAESPSLRGSGLKFGLVKGLAVAKSMSPSLRGSGLKCIYGDTAATTILQGLPLYEGVD